MLSTVVSDAENKLGPHDMDTETGGFFDESCMVALIVIIVFELVDGIVYRDGVIEAEGLICKFALFLYFAMRKMG